VVPRTGFEPVTYGLEGSNQAFLGCFSACASQLVMNSSFGSSKIQRLTAVLKYSAYIREIKLLFPPFFILAIAGEYRYG